MGWRLAEEVAWARPERPGPEWWTLLDLAQDARDSTRQGMPGVEYLAARAKRSEATVYRRLKALADAKLIKVAVPSAPGRRAVYEIPILHSAPVDNPATPLTNADTRAEGNASQRLREEHLAKTAATPRSVSESPPVITPPSDPSEIKHLTSPVPVEGARARPDQDRFISDEEWERRERVAARAVGPLPQAAP